jgi:hypothetical protein
VVDVASRKIENSRLKLFEHDARFTAGLLGPSKHAHRFDCKGDRYLTAPYLRVVDDLDTLARAVDNNGNVLLPV